MFKVFRIITTVFLGVLSVQTSYAGRPTNFEQVKQVTDPAEKETASKSEFKLQNWARLEVPEKDLEITNTCGNGIFRRRAVYQCNDLYAQYGYTFFTSYAPARPCNLPPYLNLPSTYPSACSTAGIPYYPPTVWWTTSGYYRPVTRVYWYPEYRTEWEWVNSCDRPVRVAANPLPYVIEVH